MGRETAHVAYLLVAVGANQDAQTTIDLVRETTDEVILFYSAGGKDSIVLLDMVQPRFKRVVCCFMYFVKDMRHQKPYLDYARSFPNVELVQCPHYMLNDIYRAGVYCTPNAAIPVKRLRDVDEWVRQKTGIGHSMYGMKKVDGLTRRLMLNQYENNICRPTNKSYPLANWKKSDVLSYLKMKKLPKPVSYGSGKQSSGLSFSPQVLSWLSKRYPDDLERIYKAFPFSRQIQLEDEQV